MTSSHRPVAAMAVLFVLAGCASADLSQASVDTRSSCHASNGDFVPAASCSFSHSRTTSRTTTTTTTTTSGPAPVGDEDDKP